MDRTLIILALIQLYANIRFSIMGIGTLTREMEDTEVGTNNMCVCIYMYTHICCCFFNVGGWGV